MIIVGFFYTKYSNKIADMVGDLGIGNKYFGGGGAYTLHQIIGVVIIIIGILWTTGAFQFILVKTFGNFFQVVAPTPDTTSGLLMMFRS